MSRIRASLIFDPNRREEQMAFVRERVSDLHEYGAQVWTSITEDQAARFAERGILVQLHEGSDLIQLPAVVFDPSQAVPEPPADLAALEPSGNETAYYLAQFIAPPDPNWISFIEELGASLVQDVPAQARVFRMTAAQAAQTVDAREEAGVNWVGLYHPAYALHYYLAGRDEPFTAADLRTLRVDPARVVATDIGTLEVSFFLDRTTAEMGPVLEAIGATVRTDTGHSLVIDVSAQKVADLLRIPGVWAVETYAGGSLSNQRAGRILAANQVRNFGAVDFLVNLDGGGEIVGVLDSGLDTGGTPAGAPAPGMHPDFVARVLRVTNVNNAAFPSIDANPHGTHVVGSIIGDGAQAGAFPPPPAPPNPTNPRGIAPRASLIFHSLNTAAPPTLDFTNFMTAFQEAYAGGARVHSNSWQINNPAINTYSQRSGIIDRFIFLHPDLLLLFASMNAEADLNNDGILDMNSITEQGTTKNALCIGACENETDQDGDNRNYRTRQPGRYTNAAFNGTAGVATPFSISDNADDLALFSNRGRVTASNRIKPDLVAPGTNIISTGPSAMLPFAAGDARRPNTAPANFYCVFSGTSMATPIAAGAAILARQFYRTRFSQLRRPLLIEALATAAPALAFVDLPSAAAHRSGCVLAWVRPTAAAGPNHAVAAGFDRQLRQIGGIVQLQADVGAHPAITVARHGDNTLLAHRGSDNNIRLSLYDPLLAPVAAFGTAGVVTLAKASRAEDDRRPTLCIRDNEAAVAWIQAGTSDLLFQRFRADTGAAIDANEKLLGLCDNTSTHPYLAHNGDRYAAVWSQLDGANYKLLLRFIDNAGIPQPVTPITLVTQAQPIREAHPVWDARGNHYLIVWVGEDAGGRRISALRVRPDGTVIGASQDLVTVAAAQAVRRPRVALHPVSGYMLLWEDNTQGTHDLYMTFLNDVGSPDGRISGNRLQISDTPNDISGFSALVDNDGALPVWQSDDEINSDLRGLYALNVASVGAFQAQVDANTPLLQNGHYVAHQLIEHEFLDHSAVALAWGGGDYYQLRAVQGPSAELHLVRTNADGKPDEAFGSLGARRLDSWIGYYCHSLLWTGARLVAACSTGGADSQVFLLDASGATIAGFGGTGKVRLAEVPANTISIQVGQLGAGANSRIFVAYSQRRDPGPHRIRYTVMTETGATAGAGTVAPRNLVAQADGAARQGWFHVVSTDAPVHIIAAWHVRVGANLIVRLNRFQLNGNPQAGVAAPIVLTGMPGDSQNAVIAPRPKLFAPPFPLPPAAVTESRRREYGVAWQYRPGAADPWEIRFSRLNRDAKRHATHDVEVFKDPANHGTEPQMVWHTDGYGLAWLKQPVGGGVHQLFFTVLDENGARVNLAAVIPGAPPPPPPPMPAPDFPLSSASADVQSFHLVWNGRAFRIAWTEIEGGKIRYQQKAIAVPRLQGESRYDEPFRQPSSALVRATLINGATNIRNTALPNIGADPNDGYGWGRINLRQSLAPAPPVTFHVRDDSAVAAGQTARYEFYLPPNTRLLRITLAWTDPPGNMLVNNLNLRVTAPASGVTPSLVYVGNRWQTGPLTPNSGPPFSDPLPAVPPVNPFENTHNVEQVVIPDPPAGLYLVEVIGGSIPANAFTQFPGQPFALVFVGSGPEQRTALVRPAVPPAGPLPFY
jgi:hypothetical protein